MILVPDDYRDFLFVINYFRVTNGGDIRMKLADHSIRVLKVFPGAWVNLPVRRIYETGTTASGFQTDLFEPVLAPSGPDPFPYSPDTSEVPISPPPPPGGYDANPTGIEVSADGLQVIFTFGGYVDVNNTVTVTVNGTPYICNNLNTGYDSITYVLPDYTPPIEVGQPVTVTYSGGTWTTNPVVGAPNNPATSTPITNGSGVPGGSNVPTLLSAVLEADGTTFTLTWDRGVEILTLIEGSQTLVSSKTNNVGNGDMTFGGGDGSSVTTLTTTGFAALSTDTVTLSAPVENWQSTDYHVKSIVYTDFPVTNNSTQ